MREDRDWEAGIISNTFSQGAFLRYPPFWNGADCHTMICENFPFRFVKGVESGWLAGGNKTTESG